MSKCPYCRHVDGIRNEELPGHDDSVYGEELSASIYGAGGAHPHIDVFQNGSNNALFIEINFCPVCGRKLVKGKAGAKILSSFEDLKVTEK